MCISLQVVIKAFVNGLYDRKLTDKIIEEERKIHFGTRVEARMTILDVDEHMKMVSELKERQLQASKAAAFDAERKRPGRNMNYAEVNFKGCDPRQKQNYPWADRLHPSPDQIVTPKFNDFYSNSNSNTETNDIRHYLPPKQSSNHPIVRGNHEASANREAIVKIRMTLKTF